MRKVIIAYVPVLHSGYIKLFRAEGAEDLYIIGEKLLKELSDFDYLVRKDKLRALETYEVCLAVTPLCLFENVYVLEDVNELKKAGDLLIVMPDEDISRAIANTYFPDRQVEFRPIFLRWHRDNVAEKQSVAVHRALPVTTFDEEIMRRAFKEGERSFDWWRQIGGIIVKDGEVVLVAHNAHVPEEQMPNIVGDPRSIFKRGINLDLSTADHAEAVLIGEAARRGIPLEGAWLYSTDFPCPPCAKLIARSGIKRCYFSNGYAVLDGEAVLKASGTELIHISV
ncbi:MAG: hypothetical protein HY457_02460 [Parcubacteria group bacterium]|nr:hypothetical protein [Parcubacteria group bacterium]